MWEHPHVRDINLSERDGGERRCAELRRRAEALAAKYRGLLPPGDAGLIEAERRRHELTTAAWALDREFEPISAEDEDEILTPAVTELQVELWQFIKDAEPEGLVGVVVKLRALREDDPEEGDGPVLGQCIDALERIDGVRALTAGGAV